MNKTEIFQQAYLKSLKRDNIFNEVDGIENDVNKLTLDVILYEIIRQEVQDIIYELFNDDEDEYDEWCKGDCYDMYDDLRKWIENGMPFAIEDEDLTELYGFSTIKWYEYNY